MAKEKKKSGTSPVLYFFTGALLLVLCIAVSTLILIRPYEKMHTYLSIVFMDSMKISPSSGIGGLVIKENEIPMDEGLETADTGEIIRPAFGEQYATLQCEAASITVPVYWGTSAELLEHGACQTTASKVLGETGNVVIDAHVNTFFANLKEIKEGDIVTLYTKYGIFTYKAMSLVTFENTDKTYVLPTETDRLTLYTCEAQVFGTSSTRVGVLCDLVSRRFYTNTGGAAE